MQSKRESPERRNTRLPEFDYAQVGAYFITIVATNRECLFGAIDGVEMRLNASGEMVNTVWRELPTHCPGVDVDWHVVMPNHFHGIIIVREHVGVGFPDPNTHHDATTGGETPPLRQPSLGQIVAYLKYESTKRINVLRGTPGVRVWQRNYHDHIVRDERDLYGRRKYIELNPARWANDEENIAIAKVRERAVCRRAT
jgi:hypothetical protein